MKFEGDCDELQTKICLHRQSRAKYLEQSKEIKQNWIWTVYLDSCICVNFDCYYKSLIFGKKTGH